jgi:hypothetical protein
MCSVDPAVCKGKQHRRRDNRCVKIYYIKNLSKQDEDTYGKFIDYSPINITNSFIDAEQPFNPYMQFIVKKASGVDHGYYSISNRISGSSIFKGITNSLKDQDGKAIDGQYVIGGDTIGLVAADVDGNDEYLGYKHFTATEITNKDTDSEISSLLGDFSAAFRLQFQLTLWIMKNFIRWRLFCTKFMVKSIACR